MTREEMTQEAVEVLKNSSPFYSSIEDNPMRINYYYGIVQMLNIVTHRHSDEVDWKYVKEEMRKLWEEAMAEQEKKEDK